MTIRCCWPPDSSCGTTRKNRSGGPQSRAGQRARDLGVPARPRRAVDAQSLGDRLADGVPRGERAAGSWRTSCTCRRYALSAVPGAAYGQAGITRTSPTCRAFQAEQRARSARRVAAARLLHQGDDLTATHARWDAVDPRPGAPRDRLRAASSARRRRRLGFSS